MSEKGRDGLEGCSSLPDAFDQDLDGKIGSAVRSKPGLVVGEINRVPSRAARFSTHFPAIPVYNILNSDHSRKSHYIHPNAV